MRNKIKNIISNIGPLDDLESRHRLEAIEWIDSGAEIFRIEKPCTPDKHLVSYFVVFDEDEHKILLVDHKKAELWLPAGGHVEPGENPAMTVSRECMEELSIEAEFWQEDPLLITVTETVGNSPKHTDVSLWYVIKGKSADTYIYDQSEFNCIKWFDFNSIPFHMKNLTLI
jgi:8-oxo-dGTP diphosphatase